MDSAEWTAYDVEKAKSLNQENEIKMTLERREELKDELKNSISMALKDPILQQGFEIICKENAELKKENAILKKALNLYVNWADECGVAWDNFPDMTEKWYRVVEEKGLGWIDGLVFMVTEEAKELLKINTAAEVKKCKYCNGSGFVQVASNTRGLKSCSFCKGNRKEN